MIVGVVSAVPELRLFVAVDPPDPVCAVLEELVEPLREVNWTLPHQYHLTLRFIGEVEASMREPIERALATIDVESFILPLEGTGAFPSLRNPRVLWAGVGKGHPRLFQLRQRVDDALLGCSLDLDVRLFHPHVTLARCGRGSSPNELSRYLRKQQDFVGPPFRVDAFTLYGSERRPGGAVHTPMLRVALRTGKTSA